MNSSDRIKELEMRLAEKNKEIKKLKEPKKYVYNCLSFVSNSDATDVAKYIEDLHQTIAQNNEELDEYVKRMEEKDKEIEKLKRRLSLTTKYKNDQKEYANNLYEKCKLKDKEIEEYKTEQLKFADKVVKLVDKKVAETRHQVCEEIRKKLKMNKYNTCEHTAFAVYYDYLKEILDQIEKGE